VNVAVKEPFAVAMNVGVVESAAPLRASVTCSWRPKPAPVTVTRSPGRTVPALSVIDGVRDCTTIPALAVRPLVAPVAITVCAPSRRL